MHRSGLLFGLRDLLYYAGGAVLIATVLNYHQVIASLIWVSRLYRVAFQNLFHLPRKSSAVSELKNKNRAGACRAAHPYCWILACCRALLHPCSEHRHAFCRSTSVCIPGILSHLDAGDGFFSHCYGCRRLFSFNNPPVISFTNSYLLMFLVALLKKRKSWPTLPLIDTKNVIES